MKTGEKIRQRRLELNMTMEDLGKAIGVQRSAINKYEKGLVDIKSSTLSAIAKALGVPSISLLDDQGLCSFDVLTKDGMKKVYPVYINSPEVRSLATGIDRMPARQREAIIAMMQGLYPGLFEEGNENDET